MLLFSETKFKSPKFNFELKNFETKIVDDGTTFKILKWDYFTGEALSLLNSSPGIKYQHSQPKASILKLRQSNLQCQTGLWRCQRMLLTVIIEALNDVINFLWSCIKRSVLSIIKLRTEQCRCQWMLPTVIYLALFNVLNFDVVIL